MINTTAHITPDLIAAHPRGVGVENRILRRILRRAVVQPTGCIEWTSGTNFWSYPRLSIKGGYKSVHRLSWSFAFGEIPFGQVVRHRCNNPKCFNVEHLILGTPADNARDIDEAGRRPRGVDHGAAIFSEEQVREIFVAAEPLKVLAQRFNCTCATISDIKRGKTWRHVTGANPEEIARNYAKGVRNGAGKLTESDVLAIRQDRRPLKAIAAEYAISMTHLISIRKRTRWNHLSAGENEVSITRKPALGTASGRAKLTDVNVREIFLSKESIRALARRFSVGETTISHIRKGDTWRHITDSLRSS